LGQRCTRLSAFPSIGKKISQKIHVSLEQQKTAFIKKFFTTRLFFYDTAAESAKNRKKHENLHFQGASAEQIRGSPFYFATGPERKSAHRQAGPEVKRNK